MFKIMAGVIYEAADAMIAAGKGGAIVSAEAIARGLAKEQREALCAMPSDADQSRWWGAPWRDVGLPLVELGLVDYSGRSPRGRPIRVPTPLGLEVRAIIAGETK
jgi:hypothetical protein